MTRSGRCGLACSRAGRMGMPPVDSERRSVRRMSMRPREERRRRAASRVASLRERGWIAPRSSSSSAGPARRKGVCSAGARTAYRLIRSAPRASALRRRVSASTRRRKAATPVRTSSRVKREAKLLPEAGPLTPDPEPPEPPLPSPEPPGASSAASCMRASAPAMAVCGARVSRACWAENEPVVAALARAPSSATTRAASSSRARSSPAARARARSSRSSAARQRRSSRVAGGASASTPERSPRAAGNHTS